MKKSIIYFFIFLLSLSTHMYADKKHWISFNNTTKFDMECTIEGLCYLSDDHKNLEVDFDANDDYNIFVECGLKTNIDGKDYIKVIITFDCNQQSTAVINSLLFCNNIPCDITIQSVACKNHRLQLQTFCNITKADQYKVILEYSPDYGIDLYPEKISFYATYAHKFKQILQNILLAALQATNYLPY